MHDPAALRARLDDVRERIARAAGRAGRDPSSVKLVAVSKTFTAEDVRAVAEAGQVDFGENKIQEAGPKIDATRDLPIRWHLIGHLQSNKARKAAAAFAMIHSVDSLALAERLESMAGVAARPIELLVQVDLAGEPAKHGATEDELWPIFVAARHWRTARLVGLMLLPPAVDEPEHARPYFQALERVRQRLLTRGADGSMLAEKSMGMSHDFEVAVEEGATLIRVGTAIFGRRPSPP